MLLNGISLRPTEKSSGYCLAYPLYFHPGLLYWPVNPKFSETVKGLKNRGLLAAVGILFSVGFLAAQSFEFPDSKETISASIGQSVRIPLLVKNTGEKPQIFVIRKLSGDLGSTQRGYFCLDKTCLEPGIDEFSRRLEPGKSLENLVYIVETGLVTGENSIQIEVASRSALPEGKLRTIRLLIHDERGSKSFVYSSRDITIYDVYPNPASEYAMLDYTLHNEHVEAMLVIHNVLGSHLIDQGLSYLENRVKINTDALPPGVYFYTVYLDKEGILTRKLVVRK